MISQRGALLIACADEARARRIEECLRDAGEPLRATWIADNAALDQALALGQAELLLVADDSPISATEAAARCAAQQPPVAWLALTAQANVAAALTAMSAGARDLVGDADRAALAHLHHVLRRELAAVRHERAVATASARQLETETRHLQLLAGTSDAVAQVREGIVTLTNPAFATRLGYAGGELAAKPLMDLIAPDQHEAWRQQLRTQISGSHNLETALRHRDGRRLPVKLQLTRANVDGEDFLELLIRQTAATEAAGGDRLALFRALDTQAPPKRLRAVLFLVVDGFEALEQRLGLEDAQRLLDRAAQKLRAQLPEADALFRYSAHEFAAVLMRAGAAEIDALTGQLRRSLGAELFSTPRHDTRLSVSVFARPVADGEAPAEAVAELVRETRRRSAEGGDCAGLLGPSAQSAAQERELQRRAAQLRTALQQNQLRLAFQSIASLEGDNPPLHDVLLRLVDESGAETHASDFIPAAEKFGLMRAVDRWVTARALELLAQRPAAEAVSRLFVKLSEDTLRDADAFLAWLRETLGEPPRPPLCFQLPEPALQNQLRKGQLLAEGLRDLGLEVAIEHFGAGTQSTQLLEQLPVHYVKFQARYASQLGDEATRRRMTVLLEAARRRAVKTIVSHVEDANTMARLWQMGVNYLQGYHVREPETVLLAAPVPRS